MTRIHPTVLAQRAHPPAPLLGRVQPVAHRHHRRPGRDVARRASRSSATARPSPASSARKTAAWWLICATRGTHRGAFMTATSPRMTVKRGPRRWISTFPIPAQASKSSSLKDGRWLMLCNDTEEGRHRLVLMISDDEGATWKCKRQLEPSRRCGQVVRIPVDHPDSRRAHPHELHQAIGRGQDHRALAW